MEFDQGEPQDVRERRLVEERAERRAVPLDLGRAHVGAVGVIGALAVSVYLGAPGFVWVLPAVVLLVYVVNLVVARRDGEEWPVAVRRAYRSTFSRR